MTGKSVESVRRRDFIQTARDDGHRGRGFDELIASKHAAMVEQWVLKAEDATRGHMIRKPYELDVNPRRLWNASDAQARKWMTEEMAAWFDQHGGRITRKHLRDAVLSGRDWFDTTMQQDFLQ